MHAILVGVAHAAGEADLRALLAGFDGEAGLYAKDLTTGREIGVLADKPFYLASITKVFIMAAVYDKLEREGLSREHVLAFTPEDYREKTRILRDRYDDTWTVARVIDPMINVSDTAATDLLVKFVGEEQLNRFVQSLGISGVGKITSIGHLDREIMRRIDPRFADVPFHLLERWMRGGEVEAIVPEYFERDPRTTAAYRLRYHGAYQDYYASGWNSATPRAVGTLLERIARGKVVSASACGHMLDTMGRSSAPRMGRRLPPTVWTYSKDGGKYRVTCSAGIVREGTFEMVVGAFTQNCDRDAGGRLVAEAAELAYRLLRPADLRLPPLSATPERLSPLFLLRDEHSQAIWNRHGQDERALVAARRAAARNRFTAGQLVRAAVSADGLPADLPLVVAADGPDGAHVRYQNVLRAGQVSSWTPGFTPTRPGTWTISFYCQGTPVRSATCTIAPATRRTP